MKKIVLKHGILLLVLILSVTLISCGGNSGSDDADDKMEKNTVSQLDDIIKRGTLKVGLSTFVPWAMLDKKGDIVGFEVDVAKQLADDMGVEIDFIQTKWSGIIPALLTGKFDIIIGGMSITPERNISVNFTDAYEYSGQSIVANIDRAPGLTTLEQLNNPDIVLAARTGSTSVTAIEQFLPNAEVRLFDDEPQGVQELLNGRVDAWVSSFPFPQLQAEKYPDKLYIPITPAIFREEPISFAVRKGEHDFMNFLNNWITLKWGDGFLDSRYRYWFMGEEWMDQVDLSSE
ncbi:MAG TPA: amino acid ABC transporter substrate-binding protein [Spirochaeta sp.]|nr:amino acid ABC transporter substrate-binding protein [Spirochaeta sp.]